MRARLNINPLIFAPESARPVMAFEAHREYHRPLQKFRIGGTVWNVASRAAFYPYARMLKNERPALIDMAFQAGFFVIVRSRNQIRSRSGFPGRCKIAVRIMAIRALNNAFIHAMFHRHIELRANRSVALVAKLALLFRQQKFRRRRIVNRMAVRADNVGLCMHGTPDIRAREILRMAAQAGIDNLRWRHMREIPDCRSASAGGHMISARPMASFAASLVGRFFPGSDGFVMRVLIKLLVQVDVADAALIAADKLISGLRWALSECIQCKRSGKSGKQKELFPGQHLLTSIE